MVIVTLKHDNSICYIGNDEYNGSSNLTYLENGYPYILENRTCYYSENFNAYSGIDTPKNVQPSEYCYDTEQGFYLNENYNKQQPNPYGIPDDLVEQIKNDAIAEIQQEVTSNVNE